MNDQPQASSTSAAPGTSRYRPLEDYALLGDGQSAALADRDGAIDWLCWPRFDSPAVFARLLGGREESGHWTVHPAQGTHWTVSRGYLADTLVLVTTFETVTGRATLTDFLHTDGSRSPRAMYRIIECTSGEVAMRSDLQLRFDFGQLRPWIEAQGEAFSVRCGAHRVRLSCEGQIAHEIDDACVRSHFVLRQGERNALRLTHALEAEVSSAAPLPAWPDADVALDQTVAYWRGWLSGVDMRSCPWAQSVRRSLLTLKALIYWPSGAMVAACTSSLPEVPGGSANWDYRYSWLRDGCFAMGAFLNAGLRDEAQRWLHWMFDAVGTSPDGVQTLYRVDGERQIPEWELGALEGYRYSQPVRVGNAASTQRQVDVIGEVLYGLSLARRAGLDVSARQRAVERQLADELTRCWRWRDSGMWESRGELRHYTWSKVMAWKGLRCALDAAQCDTRNGSIPPDPDEQKRHARLTKLCATIHGEVCREAWDAGLGSFVSFYGARDVDASLLLLPLVGFLPPDDGRVVGTVERIVAELDDGGLIRRWRRGADNQAGQDEGAFIACSCWLVDCLRLMGREAEARERLESVLRVANDVGLLAEEFDVGRACLSGNFPQALSHLGLITAALGLCGGVLDPGGG
ncbi:GH15 family glucan-1,4-alpha-glucosidase [Paraburkholderia tropica]|uniref:GH15 family glucan-1,4-alpha-glucosidase n=2 Tax=Paraburkholderia tropica TaxID=92647 RepID=A0ABX5MFN7_9BURK|nr:GH15 family glucan-1,4-alpha-glucosidase [Paraburkholderia tropica]PZW70886.1 GH15 family glucan-1,4-alpha-glucosidase [Paraburkholderia tropica]